MKASTDVRPAQQPCGRDLQPHRPRNEYTGRGPTKARAYIHDDMVVVALQEILSKGERSLVDRGRREEVLRMRAAFQETMHEDYVAT